MRKNYYKSCMNCTKRYKNCHSTCEEYLNAKKEQIEDNKKILNERRANLECLSLLGNKSRSKRFKNSFKYK